MEKCSSYEEIEIERTLTDFEQGICFAKTGKRVKRTKEIRCRCTGTKECEPCKCGGDRTKCDFYSEVREEAKKERDIEIAKEKAKSVDELLYWLRTHMTSVTRYVFNENPKHDEKYRELAQNAVNEILKLINHGVGKRGYPQHESKTDEGTERKI